MVKKSIVEIQGTFLVKVRNNAFNGIIEENTFKHIDTFLKVVRPIKIKGLTQDRFRLSVFPVSLAGATSEWFVKKCIGSITNWENLVEKFILKFHHLFDNDEEEETEEDDNPNEIESYEEYESTNHSTGGPEEPWSENGVPYQLCDYRCEPNHFKNGKTKWPTCSSDIDGFCNGRELSGMVRVECMTYFQDHKWYDELADGKLKEETLAHKAKLNYDVLVKLEECWWKVNAHEIALFTRIENFKQGPYANVKTEKTHDPYLDINRIFGRIYEASNVGDTQENQGHEEHKDNLILETSICKIRRFDMMKYSFNDDEECIAIKESEYLNHSKDSLDAYRELLRIINEGWVMATQDE
ncbi:hypothetical protein Tco_0595614 [Tanacetum coccineum]